MRRAGRTWLLLALAAVAFLAGCGSRVDTGTASTPAPPSPTTASPSPTPTLAPEDQFVADVQEAGLAGKDTDDRSAILGIGYSACRVFDTQNPPTPDDRQRGFELVVSLMGLELAKQADDPANVPPSLTTRQAESLTRSAVRNLCPWNSDVLPPE